MLAMQVNHKETSLPKKRHQVKSACHFCQKAHAACDDQRPCARCIKRGIAEQCVQKNRESPGLKGISKTYEKTSASVTSTQFSRSDSSLDRPPGRDSPSLVEFNMLQDKTLKVPTLPFQILKVSTKDQFPLFKPTNSQPANDAPLQKTYAPVPPANPFNPQQVFNKLSSSHPSTVFPPLEITPRAPPIPSFSNSPLTSQPSSGSSFQSKEGPRKVSSFLPQSHASSGSSEIQSTSLVNERSTSFANERSASFVNERSPSFVNEQSTTFVNEHPTSFANERQTSFANEHPTSFANERQASFVNEQSISFANEQSISFANDRSISFPNNRSTFFDSNPTSSDSLILSQSGLSSTVKDVNLFYYPNYESSYPNQDANFSNNSTTQITLHSPNRTVTPPDMAFDWYSGTSSESNSPALSIDTCFISNTVQNTFPNIENFLFAEESPLALSLGKPDPERFITDFDFYQHTLMSRLQSSHKELIEFSAPFGLDKCLGLTLWKVKDKGENGVLIQCNQDFVKYSRYPSEILRSNFTCDRLTAHGVNRKQLLKMTFPVRTYFFDYFGEKRYGTMSVLPFTRSPSHKEEYPEFMFVSFVPDRDQMSLSY